MKLNLGCGKQNAKGWLGLSLYNSNININFEDMNSLPFNNNSIETVFASHLVEHLTDSTNLKIMKETYRVLKPNGIFRIITPDLDTYIEWYKNNDIDKFNQIKNAKKRNTIHGQNIGEKFLNSFISWYTVDPKVKKRYITIKEDTINKVIKENCYNLNNQEGIELFIIWMKKFVPNRNSYIKPLHINAFNYYRLYSFLSEAGFTKLYKSEPLKSKDLELNKLKWDKFIDRSIIVECQK